MLTCTILKNTSMKWTCTPLQWSMKLFHIDEAPIMFAVPLHLLLLAHPKGKEEESLQWDVTQGVQPFMEADT